MSMMICNSVKKCGITDQEKCFRCVPHESSNVNPAGPVMCWRINGRVRLVPAHSYDAEGRAARLECIRQIRRIRRDYPSMAIWVSNMAFTDQGVITAMKSILATMREARKGAK